MDELRDIVLQTDDLIKKAVRQEISSVTVVALIQSLAVQIIKLREEAGLA